MNFSANSKCILLLSVYVSLCISVLRKSCQSPSQIKPYSSYLPGQWIGGNNREKSGCMLSCLLRFLWLSSLYPIIRLLLFRFGFWGLRVHNFFGPYGFCWQCTFASLSACFVTFFAKKCLGLSLFATGVQVFVVLFFQPRSFAVLLLLVGCAFSLRSVMCSGLLGFT